MHSSIILDQMHSNIFCSMLTVTLIKDMYKDATTFVWTCDGNTTDFPINIGLHQGLALSTYLFALVMDDVTPLC